MAVKPIGEMTNDNPTRRQRRADGARLGALVPAAEARPRQGQGAAFTVRAIRRTLETGRGYLEIVPVGGGGDEKAPGAAEATQGSGLHPAAR